MKWLIPAKTFLLGEYAAVAEASAIVLTTTPCFELSQSTEPDLVGIHPQSPAGLWWQQQNIETGLTWHDPYAGIGGLGASSAQFLASYLASRMLQEKRADMDSMLEAYYQASWTGKGLRPSGYDVIAQSQQGCVYINRQNKTVQCYDWSLHDLSFFLIHTGIKLATHYHLQDTALPSQIDYLSNLVDMAKNAFEHQDSQQLITCVNNYHAKLAELGLVAEHSLQLINQLKSHPEVLAIKGCGALGADIILILTSRSEAPAFDAKLKQENHTLLATENLLNFSQPLLAL
ncbi:MAG: hypothetical protein P4L79_01470 [Legionella sp.]|uniref:mevalonate kinase family protein n=1 Tax=Legionella sp. TaxID=459 RepID=UPI00284422F8|nr:hypothetical protein [Legionella sp.]